LYKDGAITNDADRFLPKNGIRTNVFGIGGYSAIPETAGKRKQTNEKSVRFSTIQLKRFDDLVTHASHVFANRFYSYRTINESIDTRPFCGVTYTRGGRVGIQNEKQ